MINKSQSSRLPSLDSPVSRGASGTGVASVDLTEFARVKSERDLYRRLLDLGDQGDPEPFVRDALSLIVEIAGATQGYLELYREGSEDTCWSMAHGLSDTEVSDVRAKISKGIIARAVSEGEMLVTPSAMLDPRFNELESVKISKIEAVLCAPIGSDPVRGVVYLQGRDHPGLYSEEEQYLARMFAMQLAPLVNLLEKANELSAEDPLAELRNGLDVEGLVGCSPALVKVLRQIPTVAPLDVGLLLTGETGTGKSQLARLVHRNSPRRHGPFVELNCGSMQENLVESELFGTVEGAFTGAMDRAGKVEAAEGGTLFLDEVGDLPLASQVKLLHVLQSGEYSRVGSNGVKKGNFRLIAATNVDLEQAVRDKAFREDLYFRLNVLQIRLPSLNERREDVAELIRYFADSVSEKHKLPRMEISRGALQAAKQAEWSGNVRELANATEAAVIRAAAESVRQIERCHLFPVQEDDGRDLENVTYQEATRIFQAGFLRDSLDENEWNISETARQLDMARSHIHNLIKIFDLRRKE